MTSLFDAPLFYLHHQSNKEGISFKLIPSQTHRSVVAIGLFLSLAPFLAATSTLLGCIQVSLIAVTFVLLLNHRKKVKKFGVKVSVENSPQLLTQASMHTREISLWFIPLSVSLVATFFPLVKNFQFNTSSSVALGLLVVLILPLFMVWVLRELFGMLKVDEFNPIFESWSDQCQNEIKLLTRSKSLSRSHKKQDRVGVTFVRSIMCIRFFKLGRENGPVSNAIDIAAFFTYFSPILIPFLTLLLIPLLYYVFETAVWMYPFDKPSLSLSVICWAAWAFAFYSYFVDRDFILKDKMPSELKTGTLHQLRRFIALQRNNPPRYFQKAYLTIYGVVITLLMPVYLDYLGSFEPAKEVAKSDHVSVIKPLNLKLSTRLFLVNLQKNNE